MIVLILPEIFISVVTVGFERGIFKYYVTTLTTEIKAGIESTSEV